MPPLFGSLEKGSTHLSRLATLGVVLAVCFALPIQFRRQGGPVFWWDLLERVGGFQLAPFWLLAGGIGLLLVSLLPLTAVARAIGLLGIGGVPLVVGLGDLDGLLSVGGGPAGTFGMMFFVGFVVLTVGVFLRCVAGERAGVSGLFLVAGAVAVAAIYLIPMRQRGFDGSDTVLVAALAEGLVRSVEHISRDGMWLIAAYLLVMMLPLLYAALALVSLLPGHSRARLAAVVGYLQIFFVPLLILLSVAGLFINGGEHSIYMPWPAMLQVGYAFFLYLYLLGQGSMEIYRVATAGPSTAPFGIGEPERPLVEHTANGDEVLRPVRSASQTVEQRLARIADLLRKKLISQQDAEEQRKKILRDL